MRNSSEDAGEQGESRWPRQTVPRLLPLAAHLFHSGSVPTLPHPIAHRGQEGSHR